MFKKNVKPKKVEKSVFNTSDFTANAANNFSVGSDVKLNVSVPQGTVSVIPGSAYPHTFVPNEGVTGLNIGSFLVTNTDSIPNVTVDISGAVLPVALVYDGVNVTPTSVWFEVSVDNTALHCNSHIATVSIGVSAYGTGLSAGVAGDMIDSTWYTSDFSVTAEPVTVVYDFTPSATSISTTAPYGVYTTLDGSATFSTSSLAGDNSGLSSVNFDISISGLDTSKFGIVSAGVSLPATNYGLGTVNFNTRFDNTYLHNLAQTKTVCVLVSTSNAQLSSGWASDVYTPSVTQFTSEEYTLTAPGANIVYDFTPSLTGMNVSVAYGASSNPLVGSATFSTSSLAGDNTGVSAVSYVIYLSGDTTHFAPFVATGVNVGLGSVAYSTRFNNNYLHASTEVKTITVVVSTSNAQLSSGWVDTYTPVTTDFVSTTYTITALGDAGSPSAITGFVASPLIDSISLTWTNPTDLDLSAVRINYETLTSVPSAWDKGTMLAFVTDGSTKTVHSPLTSYVNYNYSAFTLDNVGNWSTVAVSANNTPIYNEWKNKGAFAWETPARTLARWHEEGIV